MDKEFLVFSVSIKTGQFSERYCSEKSTIEKFPDYSALISAMPKGSKFSFTDKDFKYDHEIRRIL
jgi:hypothetical protein